MSDTSPAPAKTEAKTSTEPKASDKAESSTPKKSSPPARETSYFSSVSSDDYRAGWEGIFSNGKNKAAASPKRKKTTAEPVTIEFTDADLTKGLRTQLEKALRSKTEKEGVKVKKTARLSWRIEGEIS